MSFAKYCEFKDSLVHWIGLIPSEWELYKLSHAFGVIGSGTTPKSDEESWYCESDEGIPWVTTGELRENVIFSTFKNVTHDAVKAHSSLKIHPAGSLIIAMYGATIGRLGILAVDATTNQACCVLSVPKTLEPKYAYYWLSVYKDSIISLFSTGGGQPNINQETVSSLRISAPSLIDEQTQIARFLDHEVGKIDALIAEQEKLIALLKEKRQAVISHAVTKGLNPDAPMKDSGVEWLGQVPEHWDVNRIKFVTQVFEQGWSPQCESEPVESDEEFGVLKVGCVNGGIFRSEENKKLPSELEPITTLSLKADDLLISRANTRELVGSAAVVPVNFDNLLLCDKLYRLRLFKNIVVPQFLSFFLSTDLVRTRIETEATGASQSMLNISQSTINNLYFPCPSIEEQIQIVDYVEKQQWQILQLVADARALTNLLNERRSALISAAVTGKIDVRGWQPPAA